MTREQYTAEWWPTAHAAWERITREDIPVLWVPLASWHQEDWVDYDIEVGPPSGRSSVGRLSVDWWGLVELERRLLAPYLRRAAEYEVEIRRAGLGRDLSREGESMTDLFPAPSSSTSAAGGARCSHPSTCSCSRACGASPRASEAPPSAGSAAGRS